MKRDVEIRLEHRVARRLLKAIEKTVFDKLTKAEADAPNDFVFELRASVMEG